MYDTYAQVQSGNVENKIWVSVLRRQGLKLCAVANLQHLLFSGFKNFHSINIHYRLLQVTNQHTLYSFKILR